MGVLGDALGVIGEEVVLVRHPWVASLCDMHGVCVARCARLVGKAWCADDVGCAAWVRTGRRDVERDVEHGVERGERGVCVAWSVAGSAARSAAWSAAMSAARGNMSAHHVAAHLFVAE